MPALCVVAVLFKMTVIEGTAVLCKRLVEEKCDYRVTVALTAGTCKDALVCAFSDVASIPAAEVSDPVGNVVLVVRLKVNIGLSGGNKLFKQIYGIVGIINCMSAL